MQPLLQQCVLITLHELVHACPALVGMWLRHSCSSGQSCASLASWRWSIPCHILIQNAPAPLLWRGKNQSQAKMRLTGGLGSPGIPEHKKNNNTVWRKINTFSLKRSCINKGSLFSYSIKACAKWVSTHKKWVSTPQKNGSQHSQNGSQHLHSGSHNTLSLWRADRSTFHCYVGISLGDLSTQIVLLLIVKMNYM